MAGLYSRVRRLKERLENGVGRIQGRFLNVRGFRAELEIVEAVKNLEIGSTVRYRVKVRNIGTRVWRFRGPHLIGLSSRWLTNDGSSFVHQGLLTPLATDLRPRWASAGIKPLLIRSAAKISAIRLCAAFVK
ncbi:MAG: hypothetical protein ACREQQ_05700 [Candidatus Binatia bacterium]